MSNDRGWLLLTNDDGIEAEGFLLLVQALHREGHNIVVLAPSENHSAAGMRINLMKPMGLRERSDLVQAWDLNPEDAPVHLFELDGTPCDTVIVAMDGGLEHLVPSLKPQLVVSGVNLGPNLSQDSYHSGTMGAAREAGLYGMPAIASSFTSFDPEGMARSIEATVILVERAMEVLPRVAANAGRPHDAMDTNYFTSWPTTGNDEPWAQDPNKALLTAFKNGDLMLNLNVPPTWDGTWACTRLGVRWYRNAVRFEGAGKDEVATFTIGASSVDHSEVLYGDCDAVEEDKASLSCLAVWPQSHPFAMDEDLLASVLMNSADGWPHWLSPN
jgi:5'-nucleotidase